MGTSNFLGIGSNGGSGGGMGAFGIAAPIVGGLLGGFLSSGSASRNARRDRESQERMNAASNQTSRDTAGSRGWDAADDLLRRGVGYAQDAYDNRMAMGGYRQNVRRPTRGRGASSGSRAIAGRAQELALAGPGRATDAGMDYVGRTLEGGAAPPGSAAGMYQGAYNQAQGGSNQYIGQLFDAAQGLLPGGASAGGSSGGGGVGSGGDPSQFNIDADDPRFQLDPSQYNIDTTGGSLGAPEDWDTRAWMSSLYGDDAAVGAAGDIRALLDDPFAKSNPELEKMIRLQEEGYQRSHSADLGRLNQMAGNMGSVGGSDYQLARSQMAGENARSIDQGATGLRYQNFEARMGDFMNAMQMGSQMDQTMAAQALQAEISNRSDITDRQKTDLMAQVQRELANQGTQAGLAQGNVGAQLDIALGNQGAQVGMSGQNTQRSIANAGFAIDRQSLAQRENQAALQAMFGAAGLENDQQLGRLDLMGNFAGGVGALEQGALGAIPGLEGIEMDRLGQAAGIVGGVDRQNAARDANYNSALGRYQQNALQWDYGAQSGAVDDLIRQGRQIGGHITMPTGTPTQGYAQTGGAPPTPAPRRFLDREARYG